MARACSVRRLLAFARTNPAAILSLAPEGGDQPAGRVNWPPSGAGRFMLLLAELGFPLLPLGFFEEDGEFFLHFGPPYLLQLPSSLDPDGKDRRAAYTVMSAIASQLPERLRGEFRE